ncbi:MAG: tetratricopeptide repeat protein [Deltaproteobacteria bacterium]|nr:MAG: tetratricopeptide repeat protein [Deltaproteobacteria bacterium]
MERYGKYTLLRRIGRGGMAEVYLATAELAQGLAKTQVIKKIHPAFARSREFQRMFWAEAKIALGLNHPSIAQVFDFGQVGDTLFLAMEYVEGLDVLRMMQQCARRQVPLPFGLSAYIVQEACKALDYAHRKTNDAGEPLHIVHRDVSPQNLLVSWDGAVKVVDFGIARSGEIHEEAGVVKGKFGYMSPEQARGEPVDARSDVYSAGIVLYELACGRPAFPGKGKEVLERVRAGALDRPRDVNPAIPEELEQTILRALAFHPDDRFQTARDMQHALGRFLFRFADADAGPIDSSSLAQFLARIVPADQRAPHAPPPSTVRSRPTGSRGAPATAATDRTAVADTPVPAAVRERKNAFVVSGRICGIDSLARRLGPAAARRSVDQFLAVADSIAYKHAAHVHRASAEGLTIVVGLQATGEDDAARTVRLALDLVDALDAIGQDDEPELRLAVGIQRGAVVVTGGRARLRYELSPFAVRVADRLAEAAAGAEILVGGGVYRVTAADWNYEEVASIEVAPDPDTQPGATEGQRAKVYKLRGPKERAQRMRERARRAGDLVGRELELKALRDAYRDVLVSRRKRHIAILGDAGVGKRALVSAFLATVPPGEAVVTRAAARAATSYTPFAIIADLARDLLGLADSADSKEVRRRLEQVAATLYPGREHSREVRGLEQAVGLLLGARFDDGGDREIDASERRARLFEALVRVEHSLAADKALIVVGEDVHWADAQSRELFMELLKVPSSRPILGIVTGRPEPHVLEGVRATGADVITLDELPADAQIELLARRFAPGEPVDELARHILSRTGGNPFFINEVIDALVERGVAAADPSAGGRLRWVRRDAAIQVPTRVEALVTARIDALPPEPKQTLLFAAVLGRAFRPPLLEALLGRSADADLQELCRRGLVARAGRDFVFRNDMTMTVAYQRLPADDRATLHREAARRIEVSPAYRPGQDDAVIARHLELAGDAADAADRYVRAARHALDVGGGSDALRQLYRALKLLPADAYEARFEARRMREEILRAAGKRPQQRREIDRMRKLADALGDDARRAQAHARLAQFYLDVGRAPAAQRAAAAALDAARRSGDPLAEAEVLRLQASIARLIGNHDEALALCDRALALCDASDAGKLQRAAVQNTRGTICWQSSRLDEAMDAYCEALVTYRALGRKRDEARALNNLGNVCAERGDPEEALRHYKASLDIDRQLGNRASIPLKLGNIGQLYTDLGHAARGEKYLRRALQLADDDGDTRGTADIATSLGQARLAQGDADEALAWFERGLQRATDNRDRYQEIRALIYLAFAQLDAGRPAEGALELAQSATRLAQKMPMPLGEAHALAAQALALEALGRRDEALAAAEQAVRVQDAAGVEEGLEMILAIRARLAAVAGDLAAARAAVDRAHQLLQRRAACLQDPELRAALLGSRVARDIADLRGRLTATAAQP